MCEIIINNRNLCSLCDSSKFKKYLVPNLLIYKTFSMKNQQSISQLKQHQITPSATNKIYGGEKSATAKADEEIE